jgi:hypothetical protein
MKTMLEEKNKQVPSDEGGISFKTGLLLYVVSEAVAIGILVYQLLQR